MTSRRPSTANDASPSRMPFVSAEALLWGPEMKKQHAYLLTEMRILQKQHEGYDARIRATEAVTARIHDLAKQLSAIEAKDDNKTFENWASGEITRLAVFVDTNKNVRQQQSELDITVSHVSKKLDRFLRDNVGIEDVLRRIDILEHGRRDDANRIQGLERELERLRTMRESSTSCPMQSKVGFESMEEIRRDLIPSRKSDAERSDTGVLSNDEEDLLARVSLREDIQVSQSPEAQEINPDSTVVTASTQDHSIMSARRRLLQRPSIHDAKLPRHTEEQNAQHLPDENPAPGLYHSSPPPTQLVPRRNGQTKHATETEAETGPAPLAIHVLESVPAPLPAPTPAPQPQACGRSKAKAPTNEAPPTQLVERKQPGKRKQPDCRPQTQRQTRSQAKKNQAKEVEPQTTTRAIVVPGIQLVQETEPLSPPRKRPKATLTKQHAGNKAEFSEEGQTASRSTRKAQNQYKVEKPNEQEPVISAKSASTSTRSRRTKATASHKENPNSVPPPSVSTNTRRQKQLMVKLHLGQGDQKDIDAS